MDDLQVPDRPIDTRSVATLKYGDIVNTQGVYIVEVTPNYSDSMTLVNLSDGDSMELPSGTGRLPYYGNVLSLASE